MTFGLVDVNYSLPKGQAGKLTFFAPCVQVLKKKKRKITHTTSDNFSVKKKIQGAA